MDISPIAQAAVTVAAGLVGTLATAALAMLPRLWMMMRVSMDGSDATRLGFAIRNAAMAGLHRIEGGQPQDDAITEMVGHCRRSAPFYHPSNPPRNGDHPWRALLRTCATGCLRPAQCEASSSSSSASATAWMRGR